MRTRTHQTMEEKDFENFWELYYEELRKFRMHQFQKATNSKKHITNVRRKCVQPGSIAIQHDFTEACKIEHNREVQSNHFGGSVSVSIEGYTVHYPTAGPVEDPNTKTLFDFHSFLSDDKTQMHCTVDCHMEMLLQKLKDLMDVGSNTSVPLQSIS